LKSVGRLHRNDDEFFAGDRFMLLLWRDNLDEKFRIASPELLPNHDRCLA
jgi:hypothetical protein